MITTCLMIQLIAARSGILHVQIVLIMQQLPTPRPRMNHGIRIRTQCSTTTSQPSTAIRVVTAKIIQLGWGRLHMRSTTSLQIVMIVAIGSSLPYLIAPTRILLQLPKRVITGRPTMTIYLTSKICLSSIIILTTQRSTLISV